MVIEGQKGKGIFSKSFKEIQINAIQAGHSGIRLYVNKESEDAFNIYTHYGFVTESVKNMEIDTIYDYFDFYSKDNIRKNVAKHYENFYKVANINQESLKESPFKLKKLKRGPKGA